MIKSLYFNVRKIYEKQKTLIAITNKHEKTTTTNHHYPINSWHWHR